MQRLYKNRGKFADTFMKSDPFLDLFATPFCLAEQAQIGSKHNTVDSSETLLHLYFQEAITLR